LVDHDDDERHALVRALLARLGDELAVVVGLVVAGDVAEAALRQEVENTFNYFTLYFYDTKGDMLDIELPPIGISHGKYSVTGQPLPNDICIEVDDVANKTTKLEAIFRKNEILPLRRTITREIVKTVHKDSDEQIVINILEGPEDALPAVNLPIGIIAITGRHLDKHLIKGSDVEITVEISESRDLKVTTYLLMTDQEFIDTFTASERQVILTKLIDEIDLLLNKAEGEARKLSNGDQAELALKVKEIVDDLHALRTRAAAVTTDDVTDVKFQLDDQKRKLAQLLSSLTRDQRVTDIKLEFFRAKRYCRGYVDKYGTDGEKQSLENILASEKEVLKSNNSARIADMTERVWKLSFRIRWRTMEFLSWLFPNRYVSRRDEYLDKEKADELIAQGDKAMGEEDVATLQRVCNALWELLPSEKQEVFEKGTGIG
ncbi:MAG: hypothetical protein AAF570_01260, partial [Bacteroidota bacterium]